MTTILTYGCCCFRCCLGIAPRAQLLKNISVSISGGSVLCVPPAATFDLQDHCLSNYFQFDSRFYQQIKGTPMGSPISGLIAEAVPQRLERVVFAVISPKFWKRYVDDTFVIMKQDIINLRWLFDTKSIHVEDQFKP